MPDTSASHHPFSLTRRSFIGGAGLALAGAMLPAEAFIANAEPHDDTVKWVANVDETALVGTGGHAVAWLPQFSRLRVDQALPGGYLGVWVPRFNLTGRVLTSAVGPVPAPDGQTLAEETSNPSLPQVVTGLALPSRVSGSGNLRGWPSPAGPLLATLGHNEPVYVLNSVMGDGSQEWYSVQWINSHLYEPMGFGYVLASSVRTPRIRTAVEADRSTSMGKRFEADLQEPALITAFHDGVPVWSSMALHGTIATQTPPGQHEILWRVANETMTSERVYPPIPRNAPGGYYLTGVLWTQYFTSDGASMHYNYWSSNWGYAGSHGCLGMPLDEAKWAWDWGDVGTTVHIFA